MYSIKENKIRRLLNILMVYIAVTFAWIFFRANSLNQAIAYITKILEFDFSFNLVQVSAQKGPLNLVISLAVIILLYFSYLLPKNLGFKKNSSHLAFNVIMILLIFLWKMSDINFWIFLHHKMTCSGYLKIVLLRLIIDMYKILFLFFLKKNIF